MLEPSDPEDVAEATAVKSIIKSSFFCLVAQVAALYSNVDI
jgi:hypothetical protein